MTQLVFDEHLTAQIEALARAADMIRRRRLVHEALAAAPGERVLDVGCGPGVYVAELLDAVGADGSLVGVDISPQMLAAAARRCAGHANVSFREGDATALPVDDGEFDAALSVQVLEYVPDIAAALAELRRAVRAGGRVVIWDVDWRTVSWHSADPDRMARVLRAWDAHLTHRSLPSTLTVELGAAGFVDVQVAGHAFATAALTADAYGGLIIPLIRDYVAGHGDVGTDVVEAWTAEQHALGGRGEFYFACIQCCFTATRR